MDNPLDNIAPYELSQLRKATTESLRAAKIALDVAVQVVKQAQHKADALTAHVAALQAREEILNDMRNLFLGKE